MPKRFLYFLAIAQTILLLGHLLLYRSLLLFFPEFTDFHALLLTILIFLSFSFLIFSVAGFWKENWFLRAGYRLAACWIIIWFYLLLASGLTSIIYIFWDTNITNVALVIFGLAALLSLYGIINARITRTSTIKVKLPNLSAYWKGKTAVMVSDLHLGHVLKNGFAKKIVNKINFIKPEIVFIPGDFYDGVKTDFQGLANEFKNIKAEFGTYFCSGNHEVFAGYDTCEDALRKAGIKILENQMVEINGLQIAGVAYRKEDMKDFTQTLLNLKLDPNKPNILLKHVPLQIAEAEAAGINLQLSGHSHQGQIWPGRHITKKYFNSFDYGFKQINNFQIYISSGAGTWGPPMRVFTRSEIVKIIFE